MDRETNRERKKRREENMLLYIERKTRNRVKGE